MTFILEGSFVDRDTWSPRRCPVTKALAVIGTRSAAGVLREAYFGTHRFDDFARLAGIADAVAASRLRDLVAVGLLSKQPYQEPGQRVRLEYYLTQMALDLMPAIVTLMQWGDTYLQGELGPTVMLSHASCGKPISTKVCCAAGHVLEQDEVAMRPSGMPTPVHAQQRDHGDAMTAGSTSGHHKAHAGQVGGSAIAETWSR